MPALPIQKLFQRVDQGFAVTPFRATSDALPFGHLWYGESDAVGNAIGYAKFCSRSHDAVIRLYDAIGNVIETHEHAGELKRVVSGLIRIALCFD
jgi:hypothetical protein